MNSAQIKMLKRQKRLNCLTVIIALIVFGVLVYWLGFQVLSALDFYCI